MLWWLVSVGAAQTVGFLDGDNDYWLVDSVPAPDPGDSYTVEAWVMTTDPTVSQTVLSVQHPTLGFSTFNLSYYYSAGNALWCVVVDDDLANSATGCENVINNVQLGALAPASLISNVWVHVAATYNADTNRLRILEDGVEVGNYPVSISPTWNETVNPWWVGAESDVSTASDTVINEWVGTIAEVRVWSDWHDETTVACTKDSQLDGSEPNLLMRTSFESDLTDATGNGFDLTAQDTATFSASGLSLTAAPLDSLSCFDYDDDGYSVDDGDCDDTESTTYPGAPEICLDYIDNDCDGFGTDPTDEDGDGLSVTVEATMGSSDCYEDTDGDGLLDAIEDSNQDGVLDADETDPTDTDTDDDGIQDGVEDLNQDGIVDANESDPNNEDTDGDGIMDGWEDANRNGIRDVDEGDPTSTDSDSDGILDNIEDANLNGVWDAGELCFYRDDTDADGVDDGIEDSNQDGNYDAGEMNPLAGDTDGDGIRDGNEDLNGDGVVDANETNPLEVDTDGDGLSDGVEDANKNGQVDLGESDPLSIDSDGDGIEDGLEDANFNGILDEGETDPAYADTDGDGIDDGIEDANGNGQVDAGETDPRDLDSDDDGIYDITESGAGLTDVNSDGKTDGNVGNNGIDNTLTSDNYSDINANIDDPTTLQDTDGDVITIGDVDYRDAHVSGTPLITQILQTSTDRVIEISNIHPTNSILANSIKLSLYNNTTGPQTDVIPDVTYTIPSGLAPGATILITNTGSSYSGLVNDNITNFSDANDILLLTHPKGFVNGSTSWNNRYETAFNINNTTSYVRTDQITSTNKDFETTEWVAFVDDNLDAYRDLGSGGPERHPHSPLISEITNANAESNLRIGVHRTNPTNRTSGGWNNGFPDRTRRVVIAENFETSNKLSAKELTINSGNKLTINNN